MADVTVQAEPIELTSDDGITVLIGGTVTVSGTPSSAPTGGAGGFLSGSYPNPGVNTEALQDAVGAMAGTGLSYDDAAGTLNVTIEGGGGPEVEIGLAVWDDVLGADPRNPWPLAAFTPDRARVLLDGLSGAPDALYTFDEETGALVDPVDIKTADYQSRPFSIASSLRSSSGNPSFGEMWAVVPTGGGSYTLRLDGNIDRKLDPHKVDPWSHAVTLGPPVELMDNAAITAVAPFWPDGSLGFARIGGTDYTFGAIDGPFDVVRTEIVDGVPDGSPTSVAITGVPAGDPEDAEGVLVGAVYRDDASGRLFGFTHTNYPATAPDHTGLWSAISLVISDDDGDSWSWLGDIVTLNVDQDSPDVGDNDIGSFAPIVVHDGYVYTYFADRLADGTKVKCAVARATVAALVADAEDDIATAFSKWDGSGWGEPGLRGAPADIIDGDQTHVCVVRLSDGWWLMLTTVAGAPSVARWSTDGVDWSPGVVCEEHADDVLHPFSTLWSGDASRPWEVRPGDTPVVWAVRSPVPPFDDGWSTATLVEQKLYGTVMAAFRAGGGAGAVASVNGETGAVVLDAADVGAVPTTRTIAGLDLSANRSAADLRTALNVADGATAYTDEAARDAIGSALVAASGSGLTVTVSDPSDTITLDQSPTCIAGQDEGSAVNSVSAATLLDSTFAVGSGLLSPGDSVQVMAWLNILNNSGSSKSEVVEVVWGGLTLTLATPALASSATARPTRLQVDARMESATSVNVSAILTANNAAASIAHGESTSDHSGAVTLDLRGRVADATPTQSITLQSVVVRHDRA